MISEMGIYYIIGFFFCIYYYGGDKMNSISIERLLNMPDVDIIDIRDRDSYVRGHIPHAINIEEYDLLFNAQNYLNKSTIYYLYCDSGSRSSGLVMKLNRMGYKTVNISGGYHNYLLWK